MPKKRTNRDFLKYIVILTIFFSKCAIFSKKVRFFGEILAPKSGFFSLFGYFEHFLVIFDFSSTKSVTGYKSESAKLRRTLVALTDAPDTRINGKTQNFFKSL